MKRSSILVALAFGLALQGLASAHAQTVFVETPANIPSGPGNNTDTMQVDFGDVDLDGDWDAAIGGGGAHSSGQTKLWINQGELQGGVQGFFADETGARCPSVILSTRDVDFGDLDADGDLDLFLANTQSVPLQSSRFWINQGGDQGGTAGFYQDDTQVRWTQLNAPGCSIWQGQLLAGGGFYSMLEAQALADLDGDGDLDLVASESNDHEPTRLFLNDGAGFFAEFNPSGFKLSSINLSAGQPGLWCEGVYVPNTTNTTGAECDIASRIQDVDVADLDDDFDLDFINMGIDANTTRVFQNRSELGALAWRDVTSLVFPSGTGDGARYEQELGDLDGDWDIDVYGVNWAGNDYWDAAFCHQGNGTYGSPIVIGSTGDDADCGELIDYDGDGDLDVFSGDYGAPNRIFRNVSTLVAIGITTHPNGVTSSPQTCWDADVADVDGDGDDDILMARPAAEGLLLNVVGPPDTRAAAIPLVEHPADFNALGQPVRIRAHVFDNAAELVTAHNKTELHYSLNGADILTVPMRWSGGQVFWGELPASASGNVRYFVTSRDSNGNTGKSEFHSIDTAGGCSGHAQTYCAGMVNSQGCTPSLFFSGVPSASAGSGFVLRTSGLVPNAVGIYFYSKTGPASTPFASGLLCVAPPIKRTSPVFFGGAGSCGGALNLDFNAHIAGGTDPGLVNGATVWVQAWARDNAAASKVSMSNALRFTICQ